MKTRKGGFTLVELLIVIMIIAILAGMMMLASGSATDSAEATRVINDLRNLKAAMLLYYADNGKWPPTTDLVVTTPESLDQYMDRPLTLEGPDARYTKVYLVLDFYYSGKIMPNVTGFEMNTDIIKTGIQNKLKAKAKEVGLIGGWWTDYPNPSYVSHIYINL
jgi:general secretion pathway protein G